MAVCQFDPRHGDAERHESLDLTLEKYPSRCIYGSQVAMHIIPQALIDTTTQLPAVNQHSRGWRKVSDSDCHFFVSRR